MRADEGTEAIHLGQRSVVEWSLLCDKAKFVAEVTSESEVNVGQICVRVRVRRSIDER